MIIQQSMRLKILILPLSLVLTVVAVVFFIKPSFSDMNAAKAMLSQKQLQLDGLNEQSQNLKKLASDWGSLGEEKTLVETALPSEENLDIYVSELTSKASRSGILLSGVQVEKSSSGSKSAENSLYVCGENALGDSSVAPTSAPSAVGTEMPKSVSADLASSPGTCLNMVKISMTAKGTWEQLLDFFKYLQDMNRISNIDDVNISIDNQVQGQEQATSDLLSIDVSVSAFFKEAKKAGGPMLAADPVGQIQLNQKALEKMKEIIYSPYTVPSVSPSGERNIFK